MGKDKVDKGYDTEVKDDDHKFGGAYTDEEKFGFDSHHSMGLKDSQGWKSTTDAQHQGSLFSQTQAMKKQKAKLKANMLLTEMKNKQERKHK